MCVTPPQACAIVPRGCQDPTVHRYVKLNTCRPPSARWIAVGMGNAACMGCVHVMTGGVEKFAASQIVPISAPETAFVLRPALGGSNVIARKATLAMTVATQQSDALKIATGVVNVITPRGLVSVNWGGNHQTACCLTVQLDISVEIPRYRHPLAVAHISTTVPVMGTVCVMR